MVEYLYDSRPLTRVPRAAEFGDIEEWMKDERLTPFLGAATSANRMNGSTQYCGVFHALHAEIADLREFVSDNDAGKKFLAAFNNRYIKWREPDGFEPSPDTSTRPQHEFTAAARAFRRALTRVIVELNAQFNRIATEESTFYFSNRPKEVRLPNRGKNDDGAKNIKKMLTSLSDLNDAISRSTTEPKFRVHLFEGMWNRLISRYDRNTGVKAKLGLDIEHLTWLSDLLWLSLLAWQPLYPDSHELGIELALVSDAEDTNTWETRLARAAETFTDLARLNGHIISRFEELDPRRQKWRDSLIMDTHVTIAAKSLHMASSESNERPLIFTTNFDRGLESALEALIGSDESSFALSDYTVVYPVLVRKRPKKKSSKNELERYRLVWVARDWRRGAKDRYRWIVRTDSDDHSVHILGLASDPHNCVDDLQLLQKSGFGSDTRGPIIVKLHGSPLDQLAPLMDKSLEFERYLVLSEYQYLDFIVKEQVSAPTWLMANLQRNHVMFLGYSMSDWNVRLQIAKGAQSEYGPRHVNSPRRTALVLNLSRSECAVLQRLGVDFTQRDMILAAKALHKLYGKSLPEEFRQRTHYLTGVPSTS